MISLIIVFPSLINAMNRFTRKLWAQSETDIPLRLTLEASVSPLTP